MSYKSYDEIYIKWIALSHGMSTAQVVDHSFKGEPLPIHKVRRALRRLEKEGVLKSCKGHSIMCNPNEIYWELAK